MVGGGGSKHLIQPPFRATFFITKSDKYKCEHFCSDPHKVVQIKFFDPSPLPLLILIVDFQTDRSNTYVVQKSPEV